MAANTQAERDPRTREVVQEISVTVPVAGQPQALDSGEGREISIIAPTPWLAGPVREHIYTRVQGAHANAESPGRFWQWWRGADLQFAAARVPLTEETPLEEQVAGVYEELLKGLEGNWLYRIWNYVPGINEWREGMENYRRFNRGRARAFQAHAGERHAESLPAASAVGATGRDLVVYALSGREQPVYAENPEQVPAWQYPEQYGPIPPSFARGSVVELAGQRLGFISGTAAIKGHASLAAGDLAEQTRVTLDNLRLMAERLGYPGAFTGRGEGVPGLTRLVRVYLRHAADLKLAAAKLREYGLELAETEVTYIQAEVCRAELDIEIEARLTGLG